MSNRQSRARTRNPSAPAAFQNQPKLNINKNNNKFRNNNTKRVVQKFTNGNQATRVDVMRDVVQTVTEALNRPPFILILALCVLFFIEHYNKNGILHDYCDSKESNFFCKFFKSSKDKVFGMVICLPAVYDLPNEHSLVVGIITFASIYLLPTASILIYGIVAASIHTFYRARNNQTRYFVIFIIIVCYIFVFKTD